MENLVLSNIVVGGGNTLIPGFSNRLRSSIEDEGKLNDQVDKINIYETETSEKCDAAWRGLKLFSQK